MIHLKIIQNVKFNTITNDSLTHKAYTSLTHIQNLYKIQGAKI